VKNNQTELIQDAMLRLMASGSLSRAEADRYATATYIPRPSDGDVTKYLRERLELAVLKKQILEEVAKYEPDLWERLRIDGQSESLNGEIEKLTMMLEGWTAGD
jgi:hypothetical protein